MPVVARIGTEGEREDPLALLVVVVVPRGHAGDHPQDVVELDSLADLPAATARSNSGLAAWYIAVLQTRNICDSLLSAWSIASFVAT